MQSSSRAPVLSATLRRDSCWITDGHLPRRSCAGAAKTEQRKDAGSVRSWKLRTRPRTRRCDGLQPHPAWGSSFGLLDDLGEAPALQLRQRARLDDADGVADAGRVRFIVRVELDRRADDLLVLGVALDHVDLDDDRLVALVGDDHAAALLAPSKLALGLLGGSRGLLDLWNLVLRTRFLSFRLHRLSRSLGLLHLWNLVLRTRFLSF